MADPLPFDLAALDEFLMSDHAPDDSMGLSDLDGFLTAVAIGPEMVMPGEWLPIIWGGREPGFRDLDEAELVIGTITRRYNEIIRLLDTAPDDFDPVFWEARAGR
jgi:uncharacterized protein